MMEANPAYQACGYATKYATLKRNILQQVLQGWDEGDVNEDIVWTAKHEEQAKRESLRRMKRLPLFLLALMAALFAFTLHRPEAWAGWVHAFAEAGMVGALADWFAVVALFRHAPFWIRSHLPTFPSSTSS